MRTPIVMLFLACSLALGQNTVRRSEDLLNDCTKGPNTVEMLNCMAYLAGYETAINAMQAAYNAPTDSNPTAITQVALVCLPEEGVSVEQVRRIVVKDLEDHPEKLHLGEGIAPLVALMKAFPPCKRLTKKGASSSAP